MSFNTFNTKADLIVDEIKKNHFRSYVEVGVWKAENLCHVGVCCDKLDFCCGIDDYKVYFNDEDSSCRTLKQAEFWEIRDIAIQNLKNASSKIKLYLCSSLAASRIFPDKSLDFVFIDAAHDYESVLTDLELWFPKIRDGGIIAGHDYCEHYNGVIKAVNEFFEGYVVELKSFKIWLVRLPTLKL
jgi:hypothetical protein